MAALSDHRVPVAVGCGAVAVLFAGGAITVWAESSGAGSHLPAWPAIVFAVIAVIALVCWVTAAFRLGPFREPLPEREAEPPPRIQEVPTPPVITAGTGGHGGNIYPGGVGLAGGGGPGGGLEIDVDGLVRRALESGGTASIDGVAQSAEDIDWLRIEVPGLRLTRFANVFTEWENVPPILRLAPVRVTNLSTVHRVNLTFTLLVVHHGGQHARLPQDGLRAMVTNWGVSVLGPERYERGDGFTARAQTEPLPIDPETTAVVELQFHPMQGTDDVGEWSRSIESAELEVTDYVSERTYNHAIPWPSSRQRPASDSSGDQP